MLKSVLLFSPLGANDKLSGRGLNADKLSIIIIYVKTKIFKSRSVAPDPLQRNVMQNYYVKMEH